MEKIIIFGSGARAKSTIEIIHKLDCFDIIEIWDSNQTKWGTHLEGILITSPHEYNGLADNILVCSVYYDEIYTQLIEKYKIPSSQIKKHYYCLHLVKEKLLEAYKSSANLAIQEVLSHIQKYDLQVFNYDFPEKYLTRNYDIFWDEECGLYYVYRLQKKMYFSRLYTTETKITEYMRNLEIEQDILSPHRYLTEHFCINENDTLIDAGAAEGFFSLDVIDKVKKVILIENDDGWLEALSKTFAPYKEKVIILKKELGDIDDEKHITLDKIIGKEAIDFAKIDIEGAEDKALAGAKRTLDKKLIKKIAVCTYHKTGDDYRFKKLLESFQYQINYASGYMFFPYGEEISPYLSRGVLRATGGDAK